MREAQKWSGIGVAVDAHLARWDRLKRIQEPAKLLERTVHDRERKISEEQIMAAVNLPVLQQWALFAMSYGTADKNGVPVTSVATMEGSTISGREQLSSDKAAVANAGRFAIREYQMLDKAVTHYVSAEVVAEISQTALTANCDPLFDTDLFTPYGFAVLEEPFLVNDLHPETGLPTDYLWLAVRAIGWRYQDSILAAEGVNTGPGIELFLYTTGEDYQGYLDTLEDAGLGDEDHAWREMAGSNDFSVIEVIPWRFGSQWDINDETPEFIPGFVPSPVAAQRKWFHTFMRFCWQRIIHPQRHVPMRVEQRRWEHFAKRKELLDYTILHLRRYVDTEHTGNTGMGVPLDHRVKVRYHPRFQYYPSLGPARLPDGTMNPDSHRLIWIDEHWRGPEDGPLGAMHSATSVVR